MLAARAEMTTPMWHKALRDATPCASVTAAGQETAFRILDQGFPFILNEMVSQEPRLPKSVLKLKASLRTSISQSRGRGAGRCLLL